MIENRVLGNEMRAQSLAAQLAAVMHRKNMSIIEQRDKEIAIWEVVVGKASDSIYGVLISHLYIEHLLDRYLKSKLARDAGLFGKNGFNLLEKFKLAKALGEIDDQLLDSISKLNEIRNDCVHAFGHEISKEAIEKYGRTLGKDYKRIIREYPDAGTHGIAPITWFVCGRLLSLVLNAEGYQ